MCDRRHLSRPAGRSAHDRENAACTVRSRGGNPERSRTRSDRLSNPAAAECSWFPGASVDAFGPATAAHPRAFSRSSSLMRVFLCSSARSLLDDKIPAQKNERNFARLRARMMCIQKMRVFTIRRDLSPFTFQLSISDLSFLTFQLSNMRFHFLRFHFPHGGFNFTRFQLSLRGFRS